MRSTFDTGVRDGSLYQYCNLQQNVDAVDLLPHISVSRVDR